MRRRHVVAFTIPAYGHIHRLLPMIAGLRERGVTVDFFAHKIARDKVEQAGARFVDLYATRDKDVPDGETLPLVMRNVSFAGYWGEDVAREVAALRPDLILHDTSAVVGRVVAHHLKLPRVAMRAGHVVDPNRAARELSMRETLRISPQCWESVAKLRERHGIPDASPYTYLTDAGADLNICSEPPEFLAPDERARFEPLEFFGSYWPGNAAEETAAPGPFGPGADNRERIYVSFGTAAWLRDFDRIMCALETVADALATIPNVLAVMSLGNRQAEERDLARLRRHNVRVEPYLDQIDVLRHATLFFTHHGLNSTHEAIMHGVPMISYPFYHDQPGQAALCQTLGVAIPMEGDPLTVEEVHRALRRYASEGAALRARLAELQGWERAVMQRRPLVLDRILALMG